MVFLKYLTFTAYELGVKLGLRVIARLGLGVGFRFLSYISGNVISETTLNTLYQKVKYMVYNVTYIKYNQG